MNGVNFRGRRQRGVGLVEVLVAVLVLSIGMLGLAGLQLRTLRNNESALQRAVAVAETHAIVDAMRADRTNAVNNRFNLALGAAPPAGNTFREVVLRSWRQNLINSLGPDATGAVRCTGGPWCEIRIQWNDERATAGIAAMEVLTEVQL